MVLIYFCHHTRSMKACMWILLFMILNNVQGLWGYKHDTDLFFKMAAMIFCCCTVSIISLYIGSGCNIVNVSLYSLHSCKHVLPTVLIIPRTSGLCYLSHLPGVAYTLYSSI